MHESASDSQTKDALDLRKRRFRWGEFLIELVVRGLGFSSILFVTLIFLYLLKEAYPAFLDIPLSNLFDEKWYPTFDLYGTVPLLLGSILVTVVSIAIALPLGLCTAIYIREVAPHTVRNVLKPIIETLAGIPSVVLGFFGMTILAPFLRETLDVPTGLCALTGGVLLAYMALPTIISVAEDALDAVPNSLRDAGLAMGATTWQTIWHIIVPAARSGITTAILLGMGRAMGETMAVMMVTGNAARMPLGLDALVRPVRTMTATIAAEMGEVAQGSTHYHALFAIALILFVATFLLNLGAARAMFTKRRQGGLR